MEGNETLKFSKKIKTRTRPPELKQSLDWTGRTNGSHFLNEAENLIDIDTWHLTELTWYDFFFKCLGLGLDNQSSASRLNLDSKYMPL